MKSSRKAVLTAIVSDLAIATAKLIAWAFTHSSGMLSEAIHSLVDAGNGSLLVLGLNRSRKQADETHPFGYGKELYFWTLLVALFVFFAGGGASIAEGYLRVRNPQPLDHYLWIYVTLGVAGLFEGYSLYVGLEEFRAGEGVPASWQAIRASKNPSTFTVIVEDFAALAGLFIAFLGTIFDQTLGWHRADGISSLAIGVILMVVALFLMLESKELLVGEGANVSTLREIRRLTQAEPGVELAGYPMTMYFGPGSILLTMNIRFLGSLSRNGIEEAVDRIEAMVRRRYPNIHHIYLEAESLRPSARLADPAYPGGSDLPPDPPGVAEVYKRDDT
jgi:cation diffusion facilitator family transporter